MTNCLAAAEYSMVIGLLASSNSAARLYSRHPQQRAQDCHENAGCKSTAHAQPGAAARTSETFRQRPKGRRLGPIRRNVRRAHEERNV